MERQQQAEIVNTLAQSVTAKILAEIERGDIPENWDGFELRQILADRFADQAFPMERRRRREYNNTKLVTNL